MESIAERLRERGRVTGAGKPLASIGHACRTRLAARALDEAFRRRRERDDMEFVRTHGGRARTAALETRFVEIFDRRADWDKAYFEARGWEREPAPTS